jgi:hypothetical protein
MVGWPVPSDVPVPRVRGEENLVSEPLYICPHCLHAGFSRRGLSDHYCRALPRQADGRRARLSAEDVEKSLRAPMLAPAPEEKPQVVARCCQCGVALPTGHSGAACPNCQRTWGGDYQTGHGRPGD